ncbi:MAG: ATP synthase F1 subunit gamma [Clostridiales bacterium]|nr:ATP synthase F1 subunit gamma [Clostridiales bacterium]
MAANMKAVKLRIKSIQSTMQITRAMGLVASSKMRRAKDRALSSRPAFEMLRRNLAEIANGNTDFMSPYTRAGKSEKWCYVVIAGDRGLAGGYNANVFKLVEVEAADKDYDVMPIGKKAVEYFKRRGKELVTEEFAEAANISIGDCFEMARLLCGEFRSGKYGHIALCYTNFVSMLTQRPENTALLPLQDFGEEQTEPVRNLILYEPNSEEVFDAIVPEYLAALLYGSLCESVASELAARRNAMDAATKNAGEMIEKLNLYYNRARQAGITNEIIEIVAGAEGQK